MRGLSPAKRDFTYVVVGCGGIGSAALYWLSTLAPGEEVLGIERFELGHVNGGSQDHSRIIRLRHAHLLCLAASPDGAVRGAATTSPATRRWPPTCTLVRYNTRNANRAYAYDSCVAWKAVEDESGVQLVNKTGALVFGPKSGTEVSKVRDMVESV